VHPEGESSQLSVAYINAFAYARGAANTARADGFIEALTKSSIHVSRMEHNSYVSKKWESRLARKLFPRKFQLFLIGSAVEEWLNDLVRTPDIVVVFGTDTRFLRRARRWASQRGIPVVNDVVDWYQLREGGSLGEKLFIALNNIWGMPCESAKCAAVVTVSRRLEDYYARRGVPSLLMPAIISGTHTALGNPTSEAGAADRPLKVAYVGAPGKRDSATIENIRTLAHQSQAGLPAVAFHLVGLGEHECVPKTSTQVIEIVGHERMPRADALDILGRMDFTVLQRPSMRRFAQAGFPSKVAESLLMGIPVISNATSDLSEHLTDRINGIILNGDTVDALRDGIFRAAAWKSSEGPVSATIQANARVTFSSSGQANRLREFLDATLERSGRLG
jgi:glycosyltransferase involved in cell wall biosynthesis